MVAILIINTFENRILELMNNINLPVHINYLNNLPIPNIRIYILKRERDTSNSTAHVTCPTKSIAA
jgi:hypothetical protein